MSVVLGTELLYLLISAVVTIWVGRALYRNGEIFLVDVFDRDATLAGAVNRLLLVGFYLLTLGFVTVALKADRPPADAVGALETLSTKVGAVLLVLGLVHMTNVYVFNKLRNRARDPQPAHRSERQPAGVHTGAGRQAPDPWRAPTGV